MLTISIVVLIILRQANCWYWKININIELQEEQVAILKKLVQQFENKPTNENEVKNLDANQTSVNDPRQKEELLNRFSGLKKD